MTRMIPETFPPIPNNVSELQRSGLDNERWVFEMLRNAPDTDDWVAFHSVPVTPEFGSQREIDFW